MAEILNEQYLIQSAWLILPLFLWTIIWKGIALWKAARNGHKKWFVALLIINILGILEIIYIFVFSKKKSKPNP